MEQLKRSPAYHTRMILRSRPSKLYIEIHGSNDLWINKRKILKVCKIKDRVISRMLFVR